MKSVLITGATGVIGEAIAKEFHKNGYKLYLHYNTNIKKAKELSDKYKNSTLIQFNISNKNSIKKALMDLNVDVLVNGAGIIKDSHIYWMSDEDWDSVINTNLNGTYYVTKTILASMVKNKNGSIVNIASVSGIVGNAGQANYSATKGAIIAFTKTLCIDLARFNIRVNAVAPGIINSEMTKDFDEKAYKHLIPQGRFGKPKEVAEVVFFLANSASYVNGEVINVSGGMIR